MYGSHPLHPSPVYEAIGELALFALMFAVTCAIRRYGCAMLYNF